LLVDPLVLTLPEPYVSENEVLAFAGHLKAWSNMVKAGHHKCLVPASYEQALRDLQRFPTPDALKRLWQTAGVTTVSYMEVFNACMSMLMNLLDLDSLTLPDHVQVYEGKVSADPDVIARSHEPVATAFRETLGYVAYARVRNRPAIVHDMALMTYPS